MDKTKIFDRLRNGRQMGPTLSRDEAEGTERLLDYAAKRNLKAADVAYILATVYHETGGIMQPIKERGGNGYFHRMYDPRGSRPALARRNGQRPGDGVIYFGRGTVQITWRGNYNRIGRLIGIPLEANPEMALLPEVATQITVDGMINGWFTGVGLMRYIPRSGKATRYHFKEARRIVNGTDKADQIATHALAFQDDLIAAGWPS